MYPDGTGKRLSTGCARVGRWRSESNGSASNEGGTGDANPAEGVIFFMDDGTACRPEQVLAVHTRVEVWAWSF